MYDSNDTYAKQLGLTKYSKGDGAPYDEKWNGVEAKVVGKHGSLLGVELKGKQYIIANGTYIELVNKNYSNMNLKDKFAIAFKGEPQKSFIKAGVMNPDESLTSDGKELFMAYLLQKNGDDFKTTVVDPILAEDAKKAE